jgi:uncharacterized protein (DUF433 family)
MTVAVADIANPFAVPIYSDGSEYFKRDSRMKPEMLKLAEAAYVAGVSLRDINRSVDEHILPGSLYAHREDRERLLFAFACPFVAFYFESASRLTSDERTRVIAIAWDRMRSAEVPSLSGVAPAARGISLTVTDEFLSIDLLPFFEKVRRRFAKLKESAEIVQSNMHVMGGAPVVRGTRVSPHDLAASVAKGITNERILDAYPGIDARTLELAVIWAKSNPVRGRPKRVSEVLPAGSKRIHQISVPRRR